MNGNRRAFLRTTAMAMLANSSVPLAPAQQAAQVLIPHSTWDCGMKDGIPGPESGMLIFEAQMSLDRLAKLGKTPYGDRRVAVGLEGKPT